MQTDLGAAGPPPTGIAQPEQTGYTQYSGKLIGDLSTSLSLTGASDTNYLTNWRNQFRYAVCNSLSTACLNIAGTSCRAALLFGGRSTGGGPRTSTQNTSSTANLDYFFEAGKGREILTSANTSFLGNTSYYSPTASAAEDVATCLFPGSFVSFSQNISNFSSGLTKSGTGSNALAAVNTVSKTVTLGSSSVTTGSVGCIWNASTVETKSLLRLYFRLNFTTKGNGLMLALADGATNLAPNNASRTQIMCGAQGSTTMGYSGVPPADASNTPPAGTSAGIKSPKIGLEFDTRYDSSRADPYTDHVAFDYWGSSSDNSLVSANNCVTNPAGDNCGTDDNTHYVGVGGVGVTAAAWGSHVVTVTTASPHGFADNQVVIVSGMSPDAYNGTYSIHVAGLSSTQFTYNLTNDPGTLTTKGMVVQVAAGSGPRNPRVATALRNVTVTSASWSSTSGGRVTINTTSPNNLVSGQKVYVSGISPAGYNGVYTVIASGLSASRFRYLLTANPGTYVSGGTVPAKESEVSTLNGSSSTVTAITTPTTHGFSTGQSVTVAGATPNGFDISGSITNNGASTSFSYPSLTDLTGITFAKESLAGMFLLKKSTTAPYKYLKYSSIPTATNIFVRLDISRTYDNTNHIALLNLKAYIGDTFGSLLTDGDICTSSTDFQDLTQDVAKLCPLRTVTLQQDSIPISALATLSAASWSSGSQLVTATTAAAHGLVNGATVTISGVKIPGDGPTAYNGTYPIIVTSANTFTYSVTSNPGSYLSGGDVEPMTSVYLGFTNSRSGTTTVEDQSATIDQLILRSQ